MVEADTQERPRQAEGASARHRNRQLEPWRVMVRKLMPGASAISQKLKTAIVQASVTWLGVDETDPDKVALAEYALAGAVEKQERALLPWIENDRITPEQLDLFNEPYSVNGQQRKFATLSPNEIMQFPVVALLKVRDNADRRLSAMLEICRLCPDKDRPVGEQM